ncbi:hypothetical protein K1719_032938 [Acacia pycnantha]|nr:hypothetical protein K1719_032938 [Acacia pycnantha]
MMRDIQMHDHLWGFAKSIASDHVFAMERTVPLKDWPTEDFLRGCSQIILEGSNIQKLPKRAIDSSENAGFELFAN